MNLQEQFENASKEAMNLKEKPSNDYLLKLYSLYKQATIGDNNDEPPANMFDFAARFKYEHWLKLKGTSKEEAMQKYIDVVNELK